MLLSVPGYSGSLFGYCPLRGRGDRGSRRTGSRPWLPEQSAGERGAISLLAEWLPLGRSGNAMILPFPAAPKTMTQTNVLDTKNCRDILQDMADAVAPRSRTIGWEPVSLSRSASPPPKIQVFRAAGIYTVVLAQDPRDIPSRAAPCAPVQAAYSQPCGFRRLRTVVSRMDSRSLLLQQPPSAACQPAALVVSADASRPALLASGRLPHGRRPEP